MHVPHRLVLVLAIILCAGRNLTAAEKEFRIPAAGHLRVHVPDGWTDKSQPLAPLIRFDKPGEASLSLTAMMPEKGRPTDADVEMLAKIAGGQYARNSVEKRITDLEPIKTETIFGYLSTYTDPAPGEGGFKKVSVGTLRMDETLITVTLLFNDDVSPAKSAAMETLRTLALLPGTALKVDAIDGTWNVVIGGRWVQTARELDIAARTKLVKAADSQRGWLMTVSFAPGEIPATQPAGKQSTVGELTVSETPQNGDLHVWARGVNNGSGYLVYLAKLKFDEATDRPVLDEVLKSIRVEKAVPKLPTKKKAAKK